MMVGYYQSVGETDRGRILVVIVTWRDNESVVRPVTAWDAPRADKLIYLKHRVENEWLP